MTRNEYRILLLSALSEAAERVEKKTSRHVPRQYLFEFYGFGISGDLLNTDEVMNRLYIDGNRSLKIVDLMIKTVGDGVSVVFVRPSGHSPVSYASTWDPGKFGPFKIMEADEVAGLL